MPLLLLPLLLATPAPTPQAAVAAALAAPGARAEVLEVRAAGGGCAAEGFEATGAVEASGEVALRLAGRDRRGAACTGAAWASVRVLAPALVLSRAVRAGEPLGGVVAVEEREVRAGRAPLATLPPGAVAARPLRAHEPLLAADVRVGPRPGEPVTVLVRAGPLEVERAGRALPCSRELSCALLPGGRRVEGRWERDRIVVEAP
jgi:hypothetical protein